MQIQPQSNTNFTANPTGIMRQAKRRRITVSELDNFHRRMQLEGILKPDCEIKELLALKRFESGVIKAIADFKRSKKRVFTLKRTEPALRANSSKCIEAPIHKSIAI